MTLSLTKTGPFLGLLVYGLAVTYGFFVGGTWASLGIGGGLLAALLYYAETKKLPRPAREVLFFVLSYLAIGLSSAVQSPYPAIAFHDAFQMATILLPLALLTDPEIGKRLYHPDMARIIALLLAATCLVMAVELAMGSPLLTAMGGSKKGPAVYNRGLSYGMILFWPLVGVLWNQGKVRLVAFLSIAVAIVLLLTESRATKLAMVVAVIVFGAAPHIERWIVRGFKAALCLFVAWPWVFQSAYQRKLAALDLLPSSWKHRTEIWDFLSYAIQQRPLEGWGMGIAHKLPPDSPHSAAYILAKTPVSHPHNVFVQLWLESGVFGVVWGVVFGFATLEACRRLPATLRPFAFAVWTACFVLCLSAYDFNADSLWAMFALVSVALTMFARQID